VCHICGKDNTMKDGGWLDKYQEGGEASKYIQNVPKTFGRDVAKIDETKQSPALNYRSVEDSARIEREKELARRKTYLNAASKTPTSSAMRQAAEDRIAQEKRNQLYDKIANATQFIGGGLEVVAPFTGPVVGPALEGAGTLLTTGSSAYLSGRDVAQGNYESALMNAGFGGLGLAAYAPFARSANIPANAAKVAGATDYVADVADTYNTLDNYGREVAEKTRAIQQKYGRPTSDMPNITAPPARSMDEALMNSENDIYSNYADDFGESPDFYYRPNPDIDDPFIVDRLIDRDIAIQSGDNLFTQGQFDNIWDSYAARANNVDWGSTTMPMSFIQKKSLLDKLKDKASTAITTADRKLGELVSPPKKLPKDISLGKLSDEINQELMKGVGVKKSPLDLRIALQGTDDLKDVIAKTQFIDPATNQLVNAGTIHLSRQMQPYGSKKFSEIVFPNRQPLTEYEMAKSSGLDKWANTLGYAKTGDYPFMDLYSNTSSQIKPSHLMTQGVSGEYNKAINEVLKRNNLGNLLSGGNGHSGEGLLRWQNLVNKGTAENLGGSYFKLKKNGGWLDKYDDGGPIQPNYNDASTSFPPNFVGQGYDTTGRNYSPAWGGQFAMGGSMPGAVGFTYARTKGIPSNGPYAKKTMASAQDGTQIKTNIPVPIDELKKANASAESFNKQYVQSPNYLSLLQKQGYSPDEIKRRQDSVLGMNNDDYTYTNFGPNYVYGDESGKTKINYNQGGLGDWANFGDIAAHEWGHVGVTRFGEDALKPAEQYMLTSRLNMKNVSGNEEAAEHDMAPQENRADLVELRKALQDRGIYDSFKGGKFKQKHLNQLRNFKGDKDEYWNRSMRLYKDKDIIKLMNTIAANNPQQGMPMAQNGMEMKYYQEGLDFRPKTISRNGSVIKDDMGQYNHPGEITEIGSNQITMQGVPYPVLGISDTGDTQMMYPNQDYTYQGSSVTEYPMMDDGGEIDPKKKPLINLGDLTMTPAELEYVNADNSGYCPGGNCLENTRKGHDMLAGRVPGIPTSGDIWTKDLGLISTASKPTEKQVQQYPYFAGDSSFGSADSWDIHGAIVKAGGKNIYSQAKGQTIPTDIPMSSFIGWGPAGTRKTSHSNRQKGLNTKYGYQPSHHTTEVVNWDEKGEPIVYDSYLNKYGTLSNIAKDLKNALGYEIENISVPKSVAGNTRANLAKKGILKTELTPYTADINKLIGATKQPWAQIKEDGKLRSPNVDVDKLSTFAKALSDNKGQLISSLRISNAEYDRLANTALALAMTESEGGGALGFSDNFGSTQGMTQLNANNIKNDARLKSALDKQYKTKLSVTNLLDPSASAVATMMYLSVADKDAKRLYEKGLKPGVKTFKQPGFIENFRSTNSRLNKDGLFIDELNKRIPYSQIPGYKDEDASQVNNYLKKLTKSDKYTFVNKDGDLSLNMKTKGNNPKLTDIEKIGYMWQSPNALKTGDAEGKSEYVNKIKNYYNLLNAKKMEQGGQLTKLDQLTNFTNYNTKQPGGWLDKYQ